MSDTRNFTVLAQEANLIIGELERAENPVAVLNDRAMADLLLLLRAARSEASARDSGNDAPAIAALIEAVSGIVQKYAETRNKYFGGPAAQVDIANLEREIDRLFKDLQQFGRR
jgi:hypothetical protein